VTSTIRKAPSQVVLSVEDGMPTVCAVNLHNLQTIQQSRLKSSNLITSLSAEKMLELARALKFALAID